VRLAVAVIVLFALTLQSYVTQVHIHPALFGQSSAAPHNVARADAHGQRPDRLPPSNRPASCPICQEILLAGHYLAPSAAGWMPPAAAAVLVAIVRAIRNIEWAQSHSWNSRAPPSA